MDDFSRLFLSRVDSPRAKRLCSLRSMTQLAKGQRQERTKQLTCADIVLKRPSRKDAGDDARRLEMLKVLVQYGADVNVKSKARTLRNKTAAMISAQRGLLQCLKFLVESGADLSLTTPKPSGKSKFKSYDDTALTLAVRFGQPACVAYLTQNLSLELINHQNSRGISALMLAARSSPRAPNGTKKKCLEHLLAVGADLNLQDKQGYTALMVALEKKWKGVVDLLLEHGARLDTVSCDGRTPLTIVTTRGEYLFKLLRHGLDPGLSSLDRSCLHSSVALRNKVKVVRALVESGMPPLDLHWTDYRYGGDDEFLFYTDRYIPDALSTEVSPLTVALLTHRPCVAKYLINKRFFTSFDIRQLCRDWPIRKALEDASEGQKGAAQECLNLLDHLSNELQSLQTLCLVVVSTACSQERDAGQRDFGRENWTRRPTFRERVQCLQLPELVKRQLLHQTPSLPGEVCCGAWRTMPQFSERYCEFCEADKETRSTD